MRSTGSSVSPALYWRHCQPLSSVGRRRSSGRFIGTPSPLLSLRATNVHAGTIGQTNKGSRFFPKLWAAEEVARSRSRNPHPGRRSGQAKRRRAQTSGAAGSVQRVTISLTCCRSLVRHKMWTARDRLRLRPGRPIPAEAEVCRSPLLRATATLNKIHGVGSTNTCPALRLVGSPLTS